VVRDVARSAGVMPRGESLRQETEAEVLVIREVETTRPSARPTSIPPLGRDELR
jgi:hypothetical protein